MAFTTANISVRELDARYWELVDPLEYSGNTEDFVVPAGFRTDFATVPRALIWLVPTYGVYTRAAVLHDYLCVEAPVIRADADGIFRRVLQELGVSLPRRWMMWAAVRSASRLSHATLKELAQFILVAVPALLFLAIPVIVVQTALAVFYVIELISSFITKHKRPSLRHVLLT